MVNPVDTDRCIQVQQPLEKESEPPVLRRKLGTSFGSCSFDEPREDVRALNLLTNSRSARERRFLA